MIDHGVLVNTDREAKVLGGIMFTLYRAYRMNLRPKRRIGDKDNVLRYPVSVEMLSSLFEGFTQEEIDSALAKLIRVRFVKRTSEGVAFTAKGLAVGRRKYWRKIRALASTKKR